MLIPCLCLWMIRCFSLCVIHDGTGDGMLFIKDDNTVPPLVDLRIMEPGAAEEFGVGGYLSPYTPPAFPPMPVRIAPHLLRTGK